MAELIRAATLDRVAVSVHWTVIAGCALLMLVSWPHVVAPICAIVGYFGAMLLHEWGHAYVARRRRCRVYRIELYPFVGVTRFEAPYSQGDHCAIAWAGVVAQALVALPVLAWVAIFGYSSSDGVNVLIGTFGWLSMFMIVVNLVPIPPLDGAIAWSLLPPLPPWLRIRRRKRLRGWNTLAGRGPTRR